VEVVVEGEEIIELMLLYLREMKI
jgi:hypothetical protein